MQLPIGANDDELEEHVFQHSAAAAAAVTDMGTRRFARRGGHRIRSSAQGRLLVLSAHPSTPAVGSVSSAERSENEPTPAVAVDNPSVTLTAPEENPAYLVHAQVDQVAVMPSGTRDSRYFFFRQSMTVYLFPVLVLFWPVSPVTQVDIHSLAGFLLINLIQMIKIDQDLQTSKHSQNH